MGGGEHPPHVERRGRRRRRSGILPRPGVVPQTDRPPGRRRLEAGVSLFRGGQSGGAALRQRPLRRETHGRLHALRLRHHEIHRPGRRKPLRRRGGQRPRPRHPAPVGRLHLLRRHLPRREPAPDRQGARGTDRLRIAGRLPLDPRGHGGTGRGRGADAGGQQRHGTRPGARRAPHRRARRPRGRPRGGHGGNRRRKRRGTAPPRHHDRVAPAVGHRRTEPLPRADAHRGRGRPRAGRGFQPAGPAVVLVRPRQGLLAQRPPAQARRHVPPPGLPGPRLGAARRDARTRRAPDQGDGRQLPARVALPARPRGDGDVRPAGHRRLGRDSGGQRRHRKPGVPRKLGADGPRDGPSGLQPPLGDDLGLHERNARPTPTKPARRSITRLSNTWPARWRRPSAAKTPHATR